jgi:hypothetical protein
MPPIVIIGMHRSGSSLLVKVMQEMGVFMGNDFDENNESRFFNRINDWMLLQAGASWDCPENFKYISDDFKALMVEIIRNRLKSIHLKKYLGNSNHSIKNQAFIWGWKDPRNTFTIKIWKEIFPGAKVIHIYRNPVDVISSLVKREISKIPAAGNRSRTGIKRKFYSYNLPNRRFFYHSFKSLKLSENFDLWKTYVNKAFSPGQEDSTEVLQISYEDLLEKPEAIIGNIIEFCNLKTENRNHEKFLQTINKTRKFAFVKSPELVEFYKKIKNDELVDRLGYGSII